MLFILGKWRLKGFNGAIGEIPILLCIGSYGIEIMDGRMPVSVTSFIPSLLEPEYLGSGVEAARVRSPVLVPLASVESGISSRSHGFWQGYVFFWYHLTLAMDGEERPPG